MSEMTIPILALAGTITIIVLMCRENKRSERRPFDDKVKALMSVLGQFLKILHKVKENTGFAPDKIDEKVIADIRAIKGITTPNGVTFATLVIHELEEHPSPAFTELLKPAHSAHLALVEPYSADITAPNPEATEALQQELARAAKTAYKVFKKLYRACNKERLFVNKNRKLPDDPFLKSIL